jgi:probable HAF family extracellular repeat protein
MKPAYAFLRRLVTPLAFSIASCYPCFSQPKPMFEIQPIPTLGGSNSFAMGLNESGQVIGWSHTPNDAYVRAFVWSNSENDPVGIMRSLGRHENIHSIAYGINDKGVVVGTEHTPDKNGYLESTNFIARTTRHVEELKLKQPGDVLRINDAGAMIVTIPHAQTGHFLVRGSVASDLGKLKPIALNNLGQVAGMTSDTERAMVFINGKLELLEFEGNQRSSANAINNKQLIGGMCVLQTFRSAGLET